MNEKPESVVRHIIQDKAQHIEHSQNMFRADLERLEEECQNLRDTIEQNEKALNEMRAFLESDA